MTTTYGLGLEALDKDAVEEGDDGPDGLERSSHLVCFGGGKCEGVSWWEVVGESFAQRMN